MNRQLFSAEMREEIGDRTSRQNPTRLMAERMNRIAGPSFARSAMVLAFVVGTMTLTGIASPPALAGSADQPIAHRTATRSTPKEASAMLSAAIQYMGNHTPAQAYTAFNDPNGKFVQNDLYVFVVGLDGVMHAHGGSPQRLVGTDVTGLEDASGKLLIREILETTALVGAGAISYVWRNPVTNKVEDKTTLFKRVGDNVVAVGSYVPRSSPEQTKEFLERAVAAIGQLGANAAFGKFNDSHGRFVRNDLYVFAIGIDDMRFYAEGASPFVVGHDVRNLRDAEGKLVYRDMVQLAKERGSATYDYVWRNPVTNKVEDKHSLFQRVDKFVVGVGYYTK
jgi:cytochrome c